VPHFFCAVISSVLAELFLLGKIVEPPVDIPGFDISMFWHERSHCDPTHQWLRQFVLDAV